MKKDIDDIKLGYPINGTKELEYSDIKKNFKKVLNLYTTIPKSKLCYNCKEKINVKLKKTDSWTTVTYCEECKHLSVILWQESYDGIRATHTIEIYNCND